MKAAVRAASACVAVGVLATGCGGGGGTTVSSKATGASTAVSPPSRTAPLTTINDNLEALTSYVVTTTGSTPTGRRYTTTTVHHGDDLAKTLVGTSTGGTITTITVGDDTWVRADAAFWVRELDPFGSGGATTQAASVAGRWVLVTGTGTADVGADEDRVPLGHPGDTTSKGQQTLDGTTVDVFADPVALTTVYVSQTEPRLPLKVAGQDGKESLYSAFDAAPAVAAPPTADTIDGRAFLD